AHRHGSGPGGGDGAVHQDPALGATHHAAGRSAARAVRGGPVTRPLTRVRSERGSMAVELVILAPLLMAFVMLIVLVGRFVTVQGDIDAAARDAARAASLQVSRP